MERRDSPPRDPTQEERRLIATGLDQRREAAVARGEHDHNNATGFGALATVLGLLYCIIVPLRTSMAAVLGAVAVLSIGPLIAGVGIRRASRREDATLESIETEWALRSKGITDWQFWALRVVTATDAKTHNETWWLFELAPGEWLAIDGARWGNVDASVVAFCAFNRLVVDGAGNALSMESDGPSIPIEHRDVGSNAVASEADALFWSRPPGTQGSPILVEGNPTARGRGA